MENDERRDWWWERNEIASCARSEIEPKAQRDSCWHMNEIARWRGQLLRRKQAPLQGQGRLVGISSYGRGAEAERGRWV